MDIRAMTDTVIADTIRFLETYSINEAGNRYLAALRCERLRRLNLRALAELAEVRR